MRRLQTCQDSFLANTTTLRGLTLTPPGYRSLRFQSLFPILGQSRCALHSRLSLHHHHPTLTHSSQMSQKRGGSAWETYFRSFLSLFRSFLFSFSFQSKQYRPSLAGCFALCMCVCARAHQQHCVLSSNRPVISARLVCMSVRRIFTRGSV